ncbi:MAG: transporter substrate-binding domain-containing protein [Halopseudomonas aestusnigri]
MKKIHWLLRGGASSVFKKIMISLPLLHPIPDAISEELTAGIFSLVPWGYEVEGDVVGIMPDLIQKISEQAKLPIKLQLVPYKRMFVQLENGEIDFAIFYRSNKSEEIAEPILRVHTVNNVVYGRSNSVLNQYEDLSNFRIAAPLGVYFLPRFDIDEKLAKTNVPNYTNAVKMFKSKRVTAVVGPGITLRHLFRAFAIQRQTLSSPLTISKSEIWIQFSHSSKKAHLKSIIKKVALELRENGTFSRLIKHGDNEDW